MLDTSGGSTHSEVSGERDNDLPLRSQGFRLEELSMTSEVTIELLKGFLEAFNRHDLDAIMDYFHDDCVFYMPRGNNPRGDRYVGKQEV